MKNWRPKPGQNVGVMTWWKSCNFKKCDYNFSFFFIPTKLLIHWSQGFPVFSHVILSKKCCYICHFLSESLKKTHILSKVSFKSQVKSVALTAFQFVVLENAPLCNERKLKVLMCSASKNAVVKQSVCTAAQKANQWVKIFSKKTSATLFTWHLKKTLDRIWFLQWLRQKNSKFSNILYYHCSRVPLWYLREFLLEIKNIFLFNKCHSNVKFSKRFGYILNYSLLFLGKKPETK